MGEMIEKCARALCVAQGRPATDNELARAVSEVAAVIDALMEPSKEMLVAGNDEARDWVAIDGYESTGYYPEFDPQLAYATFRAMLDAAKSE